jgi:hypothetical protein
MTAAKNGTVTFSDIGSSPVYAAAIYDPTGGYDGASGPPPSGSSAGLYTKEPPKPTPINIDAGKTVEVDLPFDDTTRCPDYPRRSISVAITACPSAMPPSFGGTCAWMNTSKSSRRKPASVRASSFIF